MPLRNAAVSRVLRHGFPPPLNPSVENTTRALRTNTDTLTIVNPETFIMLHHVQDECNGMDQRKAILESQEFDDTGFLEKILVLVISSNDLSLKIFSRVLWFVAMVRSSNPRVKNLVSSRDQATANALLSIGA